MVPQRHGEGFPKSNRLRKRPDFRRVQGQGNAVTRNRVKRWLREAIRKNNHRVEGCVDVVFIARREAADAGLSVLSEEVIDVFGRIGGNR